MKNENFTATIEVAASPTAVFNAIKQVPKWWTRDYEGESSTLNDEFVVDHPGQHYSRQKLIEVTPSRKIVWLVTESHLDWIKNDKKEWTNTKMIFDIATNADKTVLTFTHEGLVPEKECFSLCQQGWNIIIKNWLFHFITTGQPSSEMDNAAEIRKKYFENKV